MKILKYSSIVLCLGTFFSAVAQDTSRVVPLTVVTAAQARWGVNAPLPSELVLTRGNVLNYPATFFDPARLAPMYSGIANTNDQANGLTIRGNSPASMRWRLMGLDVVNPNHLPNAGTFDDKPTATAGGVMMFSAQLLEDGALLRGAYPAGYADALGGVMDMGLRSGGNRRFTVQAGLIGLDAAAEGPFSKGKKATYLVNYRYSTVGLLTQMGIPLGDEAIDFQDLSFKLNFGAIKVFGVGGLSNNVFARKTDSTEITSAKDLNDITFRSRTGIVGATGDWQIGRIGLQTGLALSAQENRHQIAPDGSLANDERLESRFSGLIAARRNFGAGGQVRVGVNWTYIGFDAYQTFSKAIRFNGTMSGLLTQPWVRYSQRFGPRQQWELLAGLQGQHWWLNNSRSIEPRLNLSWRGEWTVSAGRYSQMQPLWVYTTENNRDLDLSRAWHVGLQYNWQRLLQDRAEGWSLKTELYYQYQSEVPVAATGRGSQAWSLLNVPEALGGGFPLVNKGLGRNYGFETTVERRLDKGWFLLANASIFQSEYTGNDGVWRVGRWALGHIANLTAGKEWELSPSENNPERRRTFGLNGRVNWSGGPRQQPIDVIGSTFGSTTEFNTAVGFTEQFPDFFRVDLRIYWRRQLGERRAATFAMDFQNATLQQNVAYRYFDPFLRRIETKYQLGLIPNLSWRLEF